MIQSYEITYKRAYATIWFDVRDFGGKLIPITWSATLGM